MNHNSSEDREVDDGTEDGHQNHDGSSDQASEEEKYHSEPTAFGMLLRCVVSLVVGFLVGFILEKSRGTNRICLCKCKM